jgi:pyruvate/2-oxoacid:ferredoxin oxidoreductase alpha subunit
MAKGAVADLRAQGVRAGLFRPVTLWPFPIDLLRPIAAHARRLVVVEASAGQLEDELRLAGEVGQGIVIDAVRRMGGILPGQREIVERVIALEGVAS